MESIKLKMKKLAEETEDAIKRADVAKSGVTNEQTKGEEYERDIFKTQKIIAQLEEQLDLTTTDQHTAQGKAEELDKHIVDWELQITALKRRITLLEDERTRGEARNKVNTVKLAEYEKIYQENEDGRKAADLKSQSLEEKLESNENAVIDARGVAEEANHKYEETNRKLRIVEEQLQRIIERAEDFEQSSREVDTRVRETQDRAKEMEILMQQNMEKEEGFEMRVHETFEKFKAADTRAEFAERSVDKLEATIDNLFSDLHDQKTAFQQISEKLDSTLREMMRLHES